MPEQSPNVNVLMVDDDSANLFSLEVILGDMGLNLVKAYDGFEALKYVLEKDFAIILLDIQMPGMDGYKTAELIRQRERSRHTPIVFITATHRTEVGMFQGYAAGAVDFLFKPIVPEVLRAKVSMFVELFRKSEEAKQQAEQLAALNAELEEEIAKRKRISQEFDRFFTLSIELLCIADFKGYFIELNPVWEKVLGYTMEELKAKPFIEFVHPDDREATLAEVQKLARGADVIHFENRYRCKNGSYRWFLWSSTPLLDQQLIYAVARDVTDRKEAEEALRQSERLLRSVLEALPVGVWVTDEHGHIVYGNTAGHQIWGGGRYVSIERYSEYKGWWADTGKPVEADEWAMARAISKGETSLNEMINIACFDGTRKTILNSAVPILNVEGQIAGAIVVNQDITELKQTQDALRLLNETLEQLVQERTAELQDINCRLEETLAELQATQKQVVQQERLRAIGEMASGVVHDFNNALSPVLGFSEILMTNPEELGNNQQTLRYLEIINTAAHDATNIVKRLREFYRQREDDDVFLPVDLNALVPQAVSLTQPKWKDQAMANGIAIKIATELQADIPPISGNAAELREALTNLIFNAVDAMPNGGTITIRTFVAKIRDEGLGIRDEKDSSLIPHPSSVILSVSDTGIGMNEEVRQRCLEPFFTTKGESGTGLGLAMVYGIVHRHEGRLDIQSEEGKGTTFILYLPVDVARDREDSEEKAQPERRALHILVVDDEPLMRELVTRYLTGDHHLVETAANGREGLEKFHANHYDLVITDRAMPEVTGEQLAAAIKEKTPDKPVILMTGFGDMMKAMHEKPPSIVYPKNWTGD